MIEVTRRSPLTGRVHTMALNAEQRMLDCWEGGKVLIQDAFPNLSPAEREFIKTGITPEEWDLFMGEDE